MQECVRCANSKPGASSSSPSYCRDAGVFWCMQQSDPCSDSSCKSEMSGCRAQKCAEEAGDATSYDAFVQKCAQCESGSGATQNCIMAAMDWCGYNCEDPNCKSVPKCEQARKRTDKCLDGSEPVNGQCPPKPPGPDPNKERELRQAQAACQAEADKSASACDPGAVDFGGATKGAGPSIAEQCEAYRNGTRLAAQATSQALNQCLGATNSCKSACEGGAKKFASDASAAQQMSARASQCSSLLTRARAAADQGTKLLSNAELGDRCRQLAGATPSPSPQSQDRRDNRATGKADGSGSGGGGSGFPDMPGGSPANNAYSSPYNNASYSDASGQTQQPLAEQPRSPGGFREPEEAAQERDFNVGDTRTQLPGGDSFGQDGKPGGPAVQVKPIGGGGGGGIPGGDGGGAGAKLGARSNYNPNQPVSTDVLQGFQGGGGYSPSNAAPGSGGESYGDRGRGGRNRAVAGQKGQELDLRRYLPGGMYDSSRRAGGFKNSNAIDIHGPHVNFWQKITSRIQEKCRLGVLFDCR